MTWNIHAGVGADGRYDLARIVAIVARHGPDIVALQEIEARGRREDPFRLLRAALGGHAAEAATIAGPDGRYGHMVISRWPIRAASVRDVSVRGRESRAVIAAEIETPGGRIGVFATHFGLAAAERRHQAGVLARMAAERAGPVLAMGDFNEWIWRGAVHRRLSTVLPARTRLRSFPARRPAFALDRIRCRPGAMLGRSWTDPAARLASDHLPVIAELTLPL
jgi:endonuclease/exonuclease/phosphatase family metal-dependent hydrolase